MDPERRKALVAQMRKELIRRKGEKKETKNRSDPSESPQEEVVALTVYRGTAIAKATHVVGRLAYEGHKPGDPTMEAVAKLCEVSDLPPERLKEMVTRIGANSAGGISYQRLKHCLDGLTNNYPEYFLQRAGQNRGSFRQLTDLVSSALNVHEEVEYYGATLSYDRIFELLSGGAEPSQIIRGAEQLTYMARDTNDRSSPGKIGLKLYDIFTHSLERGTDPLSSIDDLYLRRPRKSLDDLPLLRRL